MILELQRPKREWTGIYQCFLDQFQVPRAIRPELKLFKSVSPFNCFVGLQLLVMREK